MRSNHRYHLEINAFVILQAQAIWTDLFEEIDQSVNEAHQNVIKTIIIETKNQNLMRQEAYCDKMNVYGL